jgi:hypothetical protein
MTHQFVDVDVGISTTSSRSIQGMASLASKTGAMSFFCGQQQRRARDCI